MSRRTNICRGSKPTNHLVLPGTLGVENQFHTLILTIQEQR